MENDRLHKLECNKKTTFNLISHLREDQQLIRLQNSVRDETRRARSGITPLTVLPDTFSEMKCNEKDQQAFPKKHGAEPNCLLFVQ